LRCTTLKVVEGGVVLFEGHCGRLAAESSEALEAFRRFAGVALPGVYAIVAAGAAISIESRPGSRLHDGMPTRLRRSPVSELRGALPKMPSPCAYDAVRDPSVATLLTSADGSEILEACVAAVVGWDGERLVLPPLDRPRVASVAEQAIRAHLPFVEAPLLACGALPLALVNAVKGVCTIEASSRQRFPEEARAAIFALFAVCTRRP
jgi:hypothetical protein